MKIYVVTKLVSDHEMRSSTQLVHAFRGEEEAELYRKSLNMPWQSEVVEVDLTDVSDFCPNCGQVKHVGFNHCEDCMRGAF